MTQRTRLNMLTAGCRACGNGGSSRGLRVTSERCEVTLALCEKCLSVLNGPLEAPVFTGIDKYGNTTKYQKQQGVVRYMDSMGTWFPADRLMLYGLTASELRAYLDALDSQEGT